MPFLDGIENDDDFPNFGVLDIKEKKIQIVPINSSNYCGVSHSLSISENEIQSAKKILEENGKEKIIELYEKQLLYDMARISPLQIKKLEEKIQNHETEILKIAVLHHNLFPVSSLEEIKPFESLTNLGFFYKFLKTYNFKLALHGHKHQSLVSWCLIPNYNQEYNEFEYQHKILTISGSTIPFKEFEEVKEIGKHIIINSDNSNIEVKTVYDSVLFLDNTQVQKNNYSIMNDKLSATFPQTTNFIGGESLDDTYSNILDFFNNQTNKIVNNLICEIRQIPHDYTQLPKSYPYLGDESQKAKKVSELVGWWSKRNSNKDDFIPITHGKRIYNFDGINQLERVAKILPKEKNSSRGIITLIDPKNDDLTDGISYAPHLMSIQFLLDEKTDNNIKYLDSIVYFRKQEMHHWWAINIAEIIKLMVEVKEKITKNERDIKIDIRSITTISAIAYFGEGASKLAVSVPKIDMLYDEFEAKFSLDTQTKIKRKIKVDTEKVNLWHLTFSLFNKLDENLNEKCKLEWFDLLEDLIPSDTKDPNKVPISIIGLKFTLTQLGLHNSFFKKSSIDSLILLFERLLEQNQIFKHFTSQKDFNANEYYENWRISCKEIINEIKMIIEHLYSE